MIAPRATYRLQLKPGFGFREAAAVADFLAGLGVSHLYTSPYLQSVPGSTHGYDVVDHRRVNEELGGEEGHREFCRILGAEGLGQVLDLVPNHMAITGPENEWWWDVLENGPSSLFAHYFDVDWEPPEEKLRNRVLLPVLPDHYGRVLERGDLALFRDGGSFTVRFANLTFPLSPRSVGILLERGVRRMTERTAGENSGAPAEEPDAGENSGAPAEEPDAAGHRDPLGPILQSLEELPDPTDTDPGSRRQRSRMLAGVKNRLGFVLDRNPAATAAIDESLEKARRDPDFLDTILEEQNYRLAYWRTGNRELDYRRFFDIDSLAALRVEDPEVFFATHGLVLDWVREGVLDGLRIDHPDGLRDPRRYLERLWRRAPEGWLIVEKILEPEEALRSSWPVSGTTGYDFLNDAGGVFVDPAGEAPLTDLYQDVAGRGLSWESVVREKKLLVLEEVLAADLNRLTHLFVQVCEGNRRFRDFTRHELREVLREVAVSLPVYRTYVEEDGRAEEADRQVLREVFQEVREGENEIAPELLGFFRDILTGERGRPGDLESELRMRFQQLTGPVTAKAVEDTASYTYLRMVALNEVGGDPGRFGLSPDVFHARCRRAGTLWPRSMLALSTHDTKRSEDVRARLHILSEIPEAWEEAVRSWTEMGERHREGRSLPDRNTEYLLYQTLVGAHPLPLERAWAYMEKAIREAKEQTSWTRPDPDYEKSVEGFLLGLYGDNVFRASLGAFAGRLVGPGRINSLAQKLLQLTAPGVPDLYQGTELWDLSLVDPDNRRPVDFSLRRTVLEEVAGSAPEEVLRNMDRGDPKMWLIHKALALRKERPGPFGPEGTYRVLDISGPARNHLLAFARGGEVVAAVPRLIMGLMARGGWGETTLYLPEGKWRSALTGDTLTGGAVSVSHLLQRFPVALLARV